MKGGEFILSSTRARDIFVPENWTDEQRLMADSLHSFLMEEVLPHIDEIDAHKDPAQVPRLLEQAGALGLLAVNLPEQYGGFGMDFRTAMLMGETSAVGFSFATSIGAQTSIGTLPILYYGNDAQKAKYLPKLGTGEWKSCYCLTEPDAGSDANSGKSRATITPSGFLLNGQKMWITNGGFADVFIVFAKIEENDDGQGGVVDGNLSAFIVEKTFGGITLGEEERKLGIKGSSTVQVFFTDCPIPAENLLGKRNEGFKIALNILNSGRIKLAVGSVAGSKFSTQVAYTYASQRKQFGKAIVEFGAIRHKLANMAARAFVIESGCYRIGGYIDAAIGTFMADGLTKEEATLKAMREYAIEAAIMKVHASEVLAYCVDEALQIHGGMGYSADLPLERAFRDARITRIYEGTSEINRLLSVGELFKRGFQTKEVPLLPALKSVWLKALKAWLLPRFGAPSQAQSIDNLKAAFLLVAGAAASTLGKRLTEEAEQETVLHLADMLAEAYVCESAWLRLAQKEHPSHAKQQEFLTLYLYESIAKTQDKGEEAIRSFATGAQKWLLLRLLRALTPQTDINPRAVREEIVAHMGE